MSKQDTNTKSEKSSKMAELKENRSVYSRMLGYFSPYKGRMIVAIVIALLACLSYALAPLLMGFAINEIGALFSGEFNEEIYENIAWYLFAMLACYALYAVLNYLANVMIISASQKAIYDMRKQIDHKIGKLPLNYYDTTTYGDILGRLTNDVENISQAFQETIYPVISGVFTMILVFIMMISISGWLTLAGLVSIPILLYVGGKIATESESHFITQMNMSGKLNGYVEEYYSGHQIVSLFGKEQEVNKGFDEINNELFNHSKTAQFLSGSIYPLTVGANNLGYVLVCFVGAVMAIAGGLTIGMIQAFVQYLTQFTTPINTIMQLIAVMQSSGASGKRVFEFLDEEEEIPETDNPKFPEQPKGKVTFDDVTFGYVPHNNLMNNLDIEIESGEKTAIVGPTGAGKTTLVNLIMRFYDVKGGAIKVDNIDIKDMKRDDLRSMFGMVLQDTWLYSGSIMENIRYGRLDATDEEVIAAAKAARAHEFIEMLPGSYDFILSEGASNIAQGQRQLLTIARALLKDPEIMILDEATSSVDTRTEGMIQDAMAESMKGRTSFVIAHRLSTIKDANKILYMENGDVKEIGTHDELMAMNGKYTKLYNSQFADSAEE